MTRHLYAAPVLRRWTRLERYRGLYYADPPGPDVAGYLPVYRTPGALRRTTLTSRTGRSWCSWLTEVEGEAVL